MWAIARYVWMHSCNTHTCKLNMPRSQRETYITDGKHTSLVIYAQKTRIPRDTCAGSIHPWETHITVTPDIIV